MKNIGTPEHSPTIANTLLDKITKKSPPLPKISDQVAKMAPSLLKESEFTKATDPQQPMLDTPINATEPDPEQVLKILGQTEKLMSGSSEIPGKVEKKETAKVKSDKIMANDLKNLFKDIAKDKKVLALWNKELGRLDVVTSKNIDVLPKGKFHTAVIIDKNKVHTVGEPLTEEGHKLLGEAIDKLKADPSTSPKLRGMLEAENKAYVHDYKENFLTALSEAFHKEKADKTEESEKKSTGKEKATEHESVHHYSQNPVESNRTPEIKSIVSHSFLGIEAFFTLVSTRDFSENLRRSNKEVKDDLAQRVKEEIRNDQIEHTERKEDESNRKVVKDVLTLRNRQVAEEMPPDVAKPSETI